MRVNRQVGDCRGVTAEELKNRIMWGRKKSGRSQSTSMYKIRIRAKT